MRRKIKDTLLIAAGSAVLAASLNLFLAPNRIAGGGVGSVGTVFLHFFGIPLAATNIGLNALLFLIAFRFLGKDALFKTVWGILTLSLFLELTALLPAYTGDLLIAALLGGALMGLGLGVILRRNGSTGGSDLAGLVLHKVFPHVSVANLILAVDCLILTGAAIVFRSLTVAAYSVLALFLASVLADRILRMGDHARGVFIISTRHETLAYEILRRLERGVTVFPATGGYTDEPRTTLFCVVSPKELPLLLEQIRRLDPAAFTVVTDLREVLGEGFKQ